ncbi:hypothetical protein [Chryseobacterium sp. MA9]|jgi:hypothetical protein|uniref:hypothetical protein n=1 Tax=Chryseobacterium sp. MA9 TaxID=2966625 RepID=UPI00210373AC|nr:hypothetical protein [Chryseobacterium sp. MA9]UTX48820.1 hypothetical protein KIK00_00695 [Chryseobacterium sp. MA9]
MKALDIIDQIQNNNQDLNDYSTFFKNLDKKSKKEFWVESFSIDNILLKEDLFIGLPEIWMNFDKEDWIDVLKENSPRPVIEKNSDSRIWDINNFKDLIILNKYFKINPFDLLLENKDQLTKTDLKSCFNYGILLSGLFYDPEDYIIELLEDSNLKYSDLKENSNKLKLQGCKERLDNPDLLKNWLNEKLEFFN